MERACRIAAHAALHVEWRRPLLRLGWLTWPYCLFLLTVVG